MKDKSSIFVIIVVVLAVGYFMLFRNDKPQGLEGVVLDVNLDQIAFDGPSLVTIEVSGEEKIIAIPSMGLPLCPAFENIAPTDSIEIGDRVLVLGEINEEGQIVPCSSSNHYLKVFSAVSDDVLGYEVSYYKGPEGYVLINNVDSTDPDFISGFSLFNRNEYEEFINSKDAREGPPAIQVRVYKNTEKLWPAVWVTKKPLESNISLAFSEPEEAVVGGANAVKYTADGLFPIETYAVAHDSNIYLLTVMYPDTESSIYKDFQSFVASFNFTKTKLQN